MLKEIMASIEEPKKTVVTSTFPELGLELNSVPDTKIVELSAAAEVAVAVATNLEKLEALAGESLGDDHADMLMSGINGQLSFTGLEPLTEVNMKSDNIKGHLGDRIETLWTKVKLIIAKIIKSAIGGIKSLFKNLNKLEGKFDEASKVLATKKDHGREVKISGSGIQVLRFGNVGFIEPRTLKSSVGDIEETMDIIKEIIMGSVTDKKDFRALRASDISVGSSKLHLSEGENIKLSAAAEVFWGKELPGNMRLLYVSDGADSQGREFKRLSLVKTRKPEDRIKSITFKEGTVHKSATEYLDAGKDLIPLVSQMDDNGRALLYTLDELTKKLDAEGWRSIESVNQLRKLITSASGTILDMSGHLYNILKATYVVSMRLAKDLKDIK